MEIDLSKIIAQEKFKLKRMRKRLERWSAHALKNRKRLSDNQEIMQLSHEIDVLALSLAMKNNEGDTEEEEE